MKNLFSLLLLGLSIIMLSSCGDDDEKTIYDYSATITSPDGMDMHLDQTLNINVDFESGTEETVHHAKVRIFNKDDNTEIYNGPAGAHVHAMSGKFEYRDEFVLSEENGASAHSNWVLEAKVWGHEAGESEVVQQVEFHVHDRMDLTQYSTKINSPDVSDKKVGDNIHIHVDFESAVNSTVHHVNVRIYNKDDGTEIYNAPGDAHVHEESGKYEWHDDFELIEANGVSAHSDWILEAKVWGHEAGMGEIVEMIEFHVHPQ